jgi:hypothetical protein
MAEKLRSEKQKQNDIACSVRLKAYHAEMKRLKERNRSKEAIEEDEPNEPNV